jgi:glutathione-regulated potassium-efflux system protein KefB
LAGLYLLNPMFRLLAAFRAREVMTAAALLVVLGAALLMQAGGLSDGDGRVPGRRAACRNPPSATSLRRMSSRSGACCWACSSWASAWRWTWTVIAENWRLIAICVVAFMILKCWSSIAWPGSGRPPAEALERAVLMAQGGEFAFVLYSPPLAAGASSPPRTAAVLTAIVIVSMALTPLMIILHDRLPPGQISMEGSRRPRGPAWQVLIIGFGRMGQVISQPLLARGHCDVNIIETTPR